MASAQFQAYSEYVDFLNDLPIQAPTTLVLLGIPNAVLLLDMLLQITTQSTLVYFNLSQLFLTLVGNPPAKYALLFALLSLLLSPLLVTFHLMLLSRQRNSIGFYKSSYAKSLLHRAFRRWFVLFQYTSMPMLFSLALKLLKLGLVAESIIIIILVLANYFIGEYHSFSISPIPANSPLLILIRIQFPNAVLENGILLATLVVVNVAPSLTSLILSNCLILVRLAKNRLMAHYHARLQLECALINAGTLLVGLGLLISYLNQEIQITFMFVCVCGGLLYFIRPRVLPEHYQPVPNQEETLQSILFGQGLFVKCFKQLVILSKTSTSHRRMLEIEILKAKCIEMDTSSKDFHHSVNCEDVMLFENYIVQFADNLVSVCDLTVAVLLLLQRKEISRLIFQAQIEIIVSLLRKNQDLLRRLFSINRHSSEVKFFMEEMFTNLFRSEEFCSNIIKDLPTRVNLAPGYEIRKRLFESQTAVAFLNIIEEVGKIMKVSKNMQAVLGYSSESLLGLSINEIIPFSIRPYHEGKLTNFVQNYSKKVARKNHQVQFYAYSSSFHVQELIVRYAFIMNDFDSFFLCGVFEQVDSHNDFILLTDHKGNLEGWSKNIGEKFKMDYFTSADCRRYNMMPLFPALIKYMKSKTHVEIRTILLRPKKMKDACLIIGDKEKPEDLWSKQLSISKQLIEENLLREAYLILVEMTPVEFCEGKVKMQKIVIKSLQHIENFGEVIRMISDLNREKSLGKETELLRNLLLDEDQITEKYDTNFSLDPSVGNFVKQNQIVCCAVNLSLPTMQINQLDESRKFISTEEATLPSHNARPEARITLRLEKNSKFLPILIVLALAFLLLLILDIVETQSYTSLLELESQNVINRNIAESIYLKSVFNANASYIRKYDLGGLFEPSGYLSEETFEYVTFTGDRMRMNKYYLFNVQIPSTLQRVLLGNRSLYFSEIKNNFASIITEFSLKSAKSLSIWAETVSQGRSSFLIRFAFHVIGSLVLSSALLILHLKSRWQTDHIEAFFKFEKTDLEEKIASIQDLVKRVESKMTELHLTKQFGDVVGANQITHLRFNQLKTTHEPQAKFEINPEIETHLQKKRFIYSAVSLSIVLGLQTVFLVVHSVLTFQQFAYYARAPTELNSCAQLSLLPNMLLANLYLAVPSSILNTTLTISHADLISPISSCPNLFALLATPPCNNCTFLTSMLSTNYRSYFSTFEQTVANLDINDTPTFMNLVYSADIVEANLLTVLTMQPYVYFPVALIIYLLSLLGCALAIGMGLRQMKDESKALEMFLQGFETETIMKNKHMSRLLSRD